MQVRTLTDRSEIQSLLERDRIWAAYALGDLDDGMFEQCEWYTAGDTLALIFKGLNFVPLVMVGGSTGIETILVSAITLPVIFLNQQRAHLPADPKRQRMFSLPDIIHNQQKAFITEYGSQLSADLLDFAHATGFAQFERIRPGGNRAQKAGGFT